MWTKTACTSPNVTYDTAGRTSTWSGWTLTYDGEGRLASACKVAGCATGDMVTMRYDADGRRVELVTRPNGGATTTVTFRYQDGALAQELTGATVSRTYVTDEAGTIVKLCDPDCSGTNLQYLPVWNGHGDALALWRIETSGSLTLANSYAYTSWGAATTFTHNGYADLGFRFLYVGHEGVATDDGLSLGPSNLNLGLLYMGARHYSPALGRFLQPDPSAAEANLYAYAVNSPVTYTDPAGLSVQRCFQLAFDAFLTLALLQKRWWEIRINKGDLPRAGKNSVEGHRHQYEGTRRKLQRIMEELDDECRGQGPKPPWLKDCYKWQRIPAPYPARGGKWNGRDVSPESPAIRINPRTVGAVVVIAGGVVVTRAFALAFFRWGGGSRPAYTN